MTEAIVTVLVSTREGHSSAEKSLLSVLADDGIPFELIYVDIMPPPAIATKIREHCATRGFKYLPHDQWIAPAAARKLALPHVTTKYVAFVDNDVMPEHGCLAKLVACAEETGAGLVSPLYLQAGEGRETTIHMAGGTLRWAEGPNGLRLMDESHELHGAPLTAAAGLVRKTVGYTEYHYVLGRTELLRRPEAISDDVLLVHEHIDLALFAHEQGEEVYIEPSARVCYIAFDSRCLLDADFYRRRWNVEAGERSLLAFGRRWRIDCSGTLGPMRAYLRGRLQQFELRRLGSSGTDLAELMVPAELAQTRCALREQALRRGYAEKEVASMENACDFATLIFDGLYRPDGRPFLNHVIGTASALVRYEVTTPVVLAGLMHAAYSHRPEWLGEDEIERSLQPVPGLNWLIRTQPAARAYLAKAEADPRLLKVGEAELLALVAANEVDLRLSGEYRATGRPLEVAPRGLAIISAALGLFGIDGLAETAAQPVGATRTWPLFNRGPPRVSFRLDARNKKLLLV